MDPRPIRFQTQAVLRQMLDEAGISPRRRYGQHFLIDGNLMQKLLDAAELNGTDCVLEVGAGTGSLTALLAQSAGRVVAVEIHRELAGLAEAHVGGFGNVALIWGDVLENKSTLAREPVDALRRAHQAAGGRLKLVANLPYDIATPLLVDLLLSDLPFDLLCFTIQREVGDRFLADPGSGDYGPVSVVMQVLCTGRRVCKIPPEAFWPVPKVHSVMIRLDVRPAAEVPVDDPSAFARFVRSFFRHRRKTVTHIAKRMDEADRVLAAIGEGEIDPAARPANLGVRDWVDLYLNVFA